MDKKIKILLGAYVDTVNAQNINCYNIAKHLDKEKFEVHVLYHTKKVFNDSEVVQHKISTNRYLKNIQKFLILYLLNYDIVYLPRCEQIDLFFASKFKHKRCIVSSYEIESLFRNKKLLQFFSNVYDAFAINNDLKKEATRVFNKDTNLLYLGCNHPYTQDAILFKKKLRRIIFVGSVIERKKPLLFVQLAQCFPQLEFVMVGDGDLLPVVKEYVATNKINNVIFKGRLGNDAVYKEFQVSDLLLMMSDSEGLPKVILEAASVGVPTIYFNRQYHVDYIEDGKNGYGVNDIEKMKEIILYLSQNPEQLYHMSLEAYNISQHYDWKNLINDYEKYFCHVLKRYHAQKGGRSNA
ncbi:MAG: glycosyltransferase family 4 protein [Megasphaera elsdenii]|nr:glycosyltransferase family 4 protein [Megasphaera elsdenii]